MHVVPTRGVAEGFASLLAYDPEAAGDDNAEAMADAADDVVAGEVTQAVRDSSCDLGPIAEGDYLGIAPRRHPRRGADARPGVRRSCSTELVDRRPRDRHHHRGRGRRRPAVTRHIEVWLQEHRPDVDAEIHHGGQPLYPYLFGIE